MGGDLGSRVCRRCSRTSRGSAPCVGIDTDPPRRRLHRAEFHLVAPDRPRPHRRDGHRVQPARRSCTSSVWEPHSRANAAPGDHRSPTQAATAILGAAAECRALESIVVRSGIEVYGRARGSLTRPDESAPVAPTSRVRPQRSPAIERDRQRDRPADRRAASARCASAAVLGPHVPSPLGRLLRMPAVPFSVLADPPFAVVEDVDVRPRLRRRRRAPPGRAGERRRQRCDHRAPGDPPRAPPPDPARRPRVVRRPGDQRAARRADPRPRRRDDPPRPPRRQRPDGRAARLHHAVDAPSR